MTEKTNNILFYTGIAFLFIGGIGLTFAAFFAIIGLPIFIFGTILVLISKRTWKKRLIPIGLFGEQ
jgi:membrane-bound ClpP family serine protease